MSIKEAIEILTHYNLYRRDDNIPNAYEMPNPKEIGIAIDKAIEVMKLTENNVSEECINNLAK